MAFLTRKDESIIQFASLRSVGELNWKFLGTCDSSLHYYWERHYNLWFTEGKTDPS